MNSAAGQLGRQSRTLFGEHEAPARISPHYVACRRHRDVAEAAPAHICRRYVDVVSTLCRCCVDVVSTLCRRCVNVALFMCRLSIRPLNTSQHSSTQLNTDQHSSTQLNTDQHSSTQLNTAQHSSTQLNTAQVKVCIGYTCIHNGR